MTKDKAQENIEKVIRRLSADNFSSRPDEWSNRAMVSHLEEALVFFINEENLKDEDIGADAYDHACRQMEVWQAQRKAAGKEVGTTGSLVDGIDWLYERIEKLESNAAQEQNRIGTQHKPQQDDVIYLLGALKNIASDTYDEWTNGANAQRTAIAAIDRYERAHGIKEKNT